MGENIRNEKGAIIIIITVAMLVFLGIAALSIDLFYLYVTRNELQNISDSAALAATRQLGFIYENTPYQEQATHDFTEGEITSIKNAARAMGVANIAAGKNITIDANDILIGRWHFDTKTFEETLDQPMAVQVSSRRDSSSLSAEGPVRTFFANIFGEGTADVNAMAVASLSSQSVVEPGNLIPVGISYEWFTGEFCGQPIKFYPTDETSCAGWNVFFGTKISDSNDACQGSGSFSDACLRKRILERWIADVQANPTDPAYVTPGAQTGDFFEFGGGNLANAIEAFNNLFQVMKGIDEDGDPNTWTAQVVVYDGSCSNPTGQLKILGFATATITAVWAPTDPGNPYFGAGKWCIEGRVICDKIELSRGGGGEYGTFGSIPNLVK